MTTKKVFRASEITIEELVEQLKVFNDYRDITHYIITEVFQKNEVTTYELYNLEGFIDNLGVKGQQNKFVSFSDLEGTILSYNGQAVLGLFLKSLVLKVTNEWRQDSPFYKATITLPDGEIDIVAIMN